MVPNCELLTSLPLELGEWTWTVPVPPAQATPDIRDEMLRHLMDENKRLREQLLEHRK